MTYVIAGLVIGLIYVIMATSITLTYSATGVLNLATGAIAFAVADLFYFLVAIHGWPILWAALLCVAVVAPLLGLALWKFIFDRLESANLVVQLVATIGLAVALPGIMNLATPHTVVFQAPGIVNSGESLVNFGAFQISRDQLAVVVGGVVVVAVLYLLIERTRAGLSMKAVVGRPVLAQTTGINTRRVSAASWVLAGTFTGLAGILVAPLTQLAASDYTSLTVAALGVALIGRFQRLIPTVAGGVALGLATSFITGYAPSSNQIFSYIAPSLPFFLLAALLLAGVRPISSRHDAAQTTTIVRRVGGPGLGGATAEAATGPVPTGSGLSMTAAKSQRPALTRTMTALESFVGYRLRLGRRPAEHHFRPAVAAISIAAVVAVSMAVDNYWLGVLGSGLAFSVIFLSFSVAAGEGGILCLGQSALVATGGFLSGRLAVSAHVPFLLAAVVGIVGAGLVGLVIGFIGTRLDQLGFALITLAFILFCTEFVYPTTSIIPDAGVNFAPLSVFGLTFSSARAQFLFNLFVFGVLAGGLVAVRHSRVGRRVAALRGNATSSQSLGINVRALRVVIFAVSAGVAGTGGILLALTQGHLGTQDVGLFTGLVWLAVAVTTGVIGVRGALVGGLLFMAIPAIFASFSAGTIANIGPVFFGLGAIVLAEDPRGGIANTQHKLGLLWARLRGPASVSARPAIVTTRPPVASAGHPAAGSAGSPASVSMPVGAVASALALPGNGAALRVEGVSVSFGGLVALDDVTFDVSPGEIVGLIGPNGAGKTTLLNVVSGFIRPNRGAVRLKRTTISGQPVHRRAREGLGRTYQRVTLFPELTVEQHVLLAQDLGGGPGRPATFVGAAAPTRVVDGPHPGRASGAAAALAPFGLEVWAGASVADLPLGVARLVELAMVFSLHPAVLLLDEPMSGLSVAERRRLSELLTALRAASGTTVLMVEHDIDTTVRIADRLVVLDFGRVIAEGPPRDVIADPAVRAAYFGRVESAEGLGGSAGPVPAVQSAAPRAPATQPLWSGR